MSFTGNLERAVGKLITGRVTGLALDDQSERAIAAGIISGVTLFKDNARDLNQLFDLISQLNALGGEEFLVAVDQEGGAVQRFDEVLTPLPSAMALAALNHDGRAFDALNTGAHQLRLLGVNCNLGPVLDVNSNPLNPIIGTRSFGDNVERIVHLAQIAARASKQNRVLGVAKHFPGHGDTFEDSHLHLAVARGNKAELSGRELKTFAECLGDFPSVLVGHVWVPAFEEDALPASLSRKMIEEVLRGDLKFDGYVFTDDMPVMKAIVDSYGLEDACVMAINAGADNVLVSGCLEQIHAVHRALIKAIDSGHIKEDRVAQALGRRKSALAVTRGTVQYTREARQQLAASVGSAHHSMLQTSMAAITAVRGGSIKLTAADGEWLVIAPDHGRYRLGLYEQLKTNPDGKALALAERRYSLNPEQPEIDELLAAAAGKNCLFLTFRALLNEGQLELAERLSAVSKKRVAVATDVPYELTLMHKWETSLATLDPSDLAMEALACVLLEGLPARGKLPVSLRDIRPASKTHA